MQSLTTCHHLCFTRGNSLPVYNNGRLASTKGYKSPINRTGPINISISPLLSLLPTSTRYPKQLIDISRSFSGYGSLCTRSPWLHLHRSTVLIHDLDFGVGANHDAAKRQRRAPNVWPQRIRLAIAVGRCALDAKVHGRALVDGAGPVVYGRGDLVRRCAARYLH